MLKIFNYKSIGKSCDFSNVPHIQQFSVFFACDRNDVFAIFQLIYDNQTFMYKRT